MFLIKCTTRLCRAGCVGCSQPSSDHHDKLQSYRTAPPSLVPHCYCRCCHFRYYDETKRRRPVVVVVVVVTWLNVAFVPVEFMVYLAPWAALLPLQSSPPLLAPSNISVFCCFLAVFSVCSLSLALALLLFYFLLEVFISITFCK